MQAATSNKASVSQLTQVAQSFLPSDVASRLLHHHKCACATATDSTAPATTTATATSSNCGNTPAPCIANCGASSANVPGTCGTTAASTPAAVDSVVIGKHGTVWDCACGCGGCCGGDIHRVNSAAIRVHRYLWDPDCSFLAAAKTAITEFPYDGKVGDFINTAVRMITSSSTVDYHYVGLFAIGVGILEQWLSDVYASFPGTDAPPRVLTDLIDSTQILEALGAQQVSLLKCFIAAPAGLNLRNLVWHGFIHPYEFSPEYLSLLSVALVSLMLEYKTSAHNIRFPLKTMSGRHMIDHTAFNNSITWNSTSLPFFIGDISNEEYAALKSAVATSSFVIPSRKDLWLTAIDILLSPNQREGPLESGHLFGLVLLLPQIEHALRIYFVRENQLDDRYLCADYRIYYTTLDVLLQTEVINQGGQLLAATGKYTNPKFQQPSDATALASNSSHKPNSLYPTLGCSLMETMQDLFIRVKGPRIRDTVAHGQIPNSELSAVVTRITLSLTLALCLKFSELQSSLPPQLAKCLRYYQLEYRSHFHPQVYLVSELTKFPGLLEALRSEISSAYLRQELSEDYLSGRGESSSLSSDFESVTLELKNTLDKMGGALLEPTNTLFSSQLELTATTLVHQLTEQTNGFVTALSTKLTQLINDVANNSATRRQEMSLYKLLRCIDGLASAANMLHHTAVFCTVCLFRSGNLPTMQPAADSSPGCATTTPPTRASKLVPLTKLVHSLRIGTLLSHNPASPGMLRSSTSTSTW
ncbi:endoplasmic reticulum membrane-associated RNA degradation protein [Pelomyxa schiedti]|nr:endoplasmic reticulum membrane-associated RNA degradation protein [Pelomyxa schiedti]